MAPPASQPAGFSPGFSALPTVVDIWSKGIAGAAIALYVSGYLVISLHHSEFGFTETNPFRPRILSAGAWFFFLSAIPVVLVVNQRRQLGNSWLRFAQFLYPFYMGCAFLSIPSQVIFELSGTDRNYQFFWWKLILGLALVGLLVFLIEWKRAPRWVSASASVVFVIFAALSIIHDLMETKRFDIGAITLWFFGVGVVTWLETSTGSRENLAATGWARAAFTALGVLFVFATFYYPHIKASWGGGSLVPVTIYFSKESPLKAGQSVSVLLIDESDAGFYIVSNKDSKAIFVPRSAVSMIYFSDKIANGGTLP